MNKPHNIGRIKSFQLLPRTLYFLSGVPRYILIVYTNKTKELKKTQLNASSSFRFNQKGVRYLAALWYLTE